jgi:hypothetical protein
MPACFYGARAGEWTNAAHDRPVPILLRPFFPWRYPLDYGSLLFATGGFLICFSGILSSLSNVIWTGGCIGVASLLVWLWPQEKKLLGRPLMQVTAVIYATGSVNALIGGYISNNSFMMAAGGLWLICNYIYGTTRKENQSAFTQAQQG